MSGLQNFVHSRGTSLTRQAAAANAKIPLKKSALTQYSQTQSNNHVRGVGNVQNSSATLEQHAQQHDQQNPQHPQSSHSQKYDAYDTDAESIDTTVNPSVVQVEDSQQGQQQYQQPGHAVSLGSEDAEVESFKDEREEDKELEVEVSEEGLRIIKENGLEGKDHQVQVDFLDRSYPHLLRTLDGDSYPSTTDGNPNEEVDQEAREYSPVLPSSQFPSMIGPSTQTFGPQLVHQAANVSGSDQVMQKSVNLFQKSANIRTQQQLNTNISQRGSHVHQRLTTPPPTSQPPAYNQVTHKVTHEVVPLVNSTVYQNVHARVGQPIQRISPHLSGPAHAQFQRSHQAELPVTIKRPAPVSAKTEPPIHQPHIEQPYVEDFHADPLDYDHEALMGMSYEQLEKESFDNDPRAGPSVLSEDMDKKPFVDRLEFVHKNFDAGKQSIFFQRLPITEWEDAGDWFLDKFSAIINRTKELRQTKRKLAREFENEIEKRHRHVSKKQHQVKEAMDQMKMRGEDLVRSPRPKKS